MGIVMWDLETWARPSANSRCGQREPMREPQTFVAPLPGRDVAHGYTLLMKFRLFRTTALTAG